MSDLVAQICRLYGLHNPQTLDRVKEVATDPAMEQQRWRSGVTQGFNAHAEIDTGSKMPEPEVRNS
jgi:hypothetical protein